tara:strand:- start:1224 stop:1523 length:300 start_codon:yes stop_codon:yes gene_type:complete
MRIFDKEKDLIARKSSKDTPKFLARLNKMIIQRVDDNKLLIKIIGGEAYKKEVVIYKNTCSEKELIRFASRIAEKYKIVRQNVTINNDIEETKTDKDTK